VRARFVTVIDGHGVGRATRRLGNGRIHADRAILRHHDRMRAEHVGAAQARAEVVRIGDAVEHEQQRRLGKRGEHVVDRRRHRGRVDQRHHALVLRRARELLEPCRIHRMHLAAGGAGARGELAHPRVVARIRHVQLANRIGPRPQAGGHRMKAVERARGAHRETGCAGIAHSRSPEPAVRGRHVGEAPPYSGIILCFPAPAGGASAVAQYGLL
jgi:hypothetical protein